MTSHIAVDVEELIGNSMPAVTVGGKPRLLHSLSRDLGTAPLGMPSSTAVAGGNRGLCCAGVCTRVISKAVDVRVCRLSAFRPRNRSDC
jgi:hypothetical protein